ncbi:RNA polymerase sigma factor [Mucilaginibacter psychrotolerans]|uniref:RNA polymerase sigma factor n=1 Tax=Mucilaginibacter psychrotolerans TaxID=1524096 RepID=UPI0013053988|nr:sigma-70 family RNA polymerase sigma factor [Mucilaginibacter psychrotolerans]
MSEKEFLQQIKQNQGIIYKLVGIYAADAEEKKDLYQEILLNTWKGWPSYRGEAKFSTWLYRICLNTIFAQKRKAMRVEYKESLDEFARIADGNAAPNDDAMQLRQAIRSLKEIDRAIVSLHLDGYDNAEIAGIMGISSNLVAVKLYRSKEQLSKLLKKQL